MRVVGWGYVHLDGCVAAYYKAGALNKDELDKNCVVQVERRARSSLSNRVNSITSASLENYR